MTRIVLAFLACLAITGCVTPSSPERSLQIACASYADALSALATRNRLGLLSADTQDRVDQIDAVAGPICDGTIPPDPNSALLTVEAALIALIEVRGESDGS